MARDDRSLLARGAATTLWAARSALRWSESVVPWPLDWIPRAARFPLDVAASLTGSDLPRDRQRTAPPPGGARAVPTEATAPERHATATIGGVRPAARSGVPSEDPEFQARLAPLYTRAAGEGPALVLLHAFPLSSRMWQPQLESLADRYRVIAPDLAGFGLSWTPESALSLARQADAVALTLDEIGIENVILVGLSLGGYVAFPLLERLGTRVAGLVLASTRASSDGERTQADRHRLAAEVEAEGIEVVASELLVRLLGASTLRDAPALVDHVHAMILENHEAGIAAALRAMAARPDSTQLLPRITCPVLVLAGDEDQVVTPAESRAMAARIPDAHVVVLKAGHLVNLEAPADFDRAVGAFARTVLDAGAQRAVAGRAARR